VFVAGAGDLARLVELRRAGDDFVLSSAGAGEVAFRLRAALAASERVTLVLDHDSRHAVVGQRRIALTRLEFAVLAHLADHPGQAFTRDDLLQAVWGSRSDWQQPSTVTEHVRRVRTKLDADAPDRWIRTVHGVGYVFVG
jgi:DNA-binding response OmpR family regulator